MSGMDMSLGALSLVRGAGGTALPANLLVLGSSPLVLNGLYLTLGTP